MGNCSHEDCLVFPRCPVCCTCGTDLTDPANIRESITIGEFTISTHGPLMEPDSLWISRPDGEGMSVRRYRIEALIKGFYEDEF
jgi:hypothetical protein